MIPRAISTAFAIIIILGLTLGMIYLAKQPGGAITNATLETVTRTP